MYHDLCAQLSIYWDRGFENKVDSPPPPIKLHTVLPSLQTDIDGVYCSQLVYTFWTFWQSFP
ncbi:hypothetical protein BHE74_00028802 [Ensete ventricosum]|nr:hypothetical protein BHE74_00028802 [Ensete ventricosum]